MEMTPHHNASQKVTGTNETPSEVDFEHLEEADVRIMPHVQQSIECGFEEVGDNNSSNDIFVKTLFSDCPFSSRH